VNKYADKTSENKSQSVSSGEYQMQNCGESTFQFVDNRPESIAQRKLQEKVNDSINKKQTIQLHKGGRQGKRNALISDAMDNYYDDLAAEEDFQNELQEEEYNNQEEQTYLDLSFDDDIIEQAKQELVDCNYNGWHFTDSPIEGDYCRFIWCFKNNIKVGMNVHYTREGKRPGNWYIKGVTDWHEPTPQIMVNNAPPKRPGTTKKW